MNRISHFSLKRLVQGLLLALLASWVMPLQAQYLLGATNTGGSGPDVFAYGKIGDPLQIFDLFNPTNGSAWGLATDNVHVYYTNPSGYIGRYKLDGTENTPDWLDLTAQANPMGYDGIPGPILGNPTGIDTDGIYVYWADNTYGSIGRVKISDTVNNHVPTPDFGAFIPPSTKCFNPYDVKVNSTNIFWANQNNGTNATIWAAVKGSDTPTPLTAASVTITNTTSELKAIALDASNNIYVGDSTAGTIRRYPLPGGGTPVPVDNTNLVGSVDVTYISPTATGVLGLVVAGPSTPHVYWSGNGIIGQTDTSTGTTTSTFATHAGTAGICYTSLSTIKNGNVITLTSFTATPKDAQVVVAWQTGSEVDTAGFNIWRSPSATGTYTKVNAAAIPAQGSAMGGASYTWADTSVSAGHTWYYKLEDIDTYGVSTMNGPVSATVGASSPILSFQATPSGIFLGGGSLLSWTTAGNPALAITGIGPVSASSLWVTPTSSTSYTLTDGQGHQNLTTVNVKPFGLLDMPGLSKTWGSAKGDANYDPSYDLNGDGKVDDADVAILFKGL